MGYLQIESNFCRFVRFSPVHAAAKIGRLMHEDTKLPGPNRNPDMERLTQAMDRARAEREAGATPAVVAPSPLTRDNARSSGGFRPPSVQAKVAYSQTTSVEVDEGRLRERRIVAMAAHDPAATAYKVLRTHVMQRMRANGWRTLGITSPGEGNGKTVTTINLAISLARNVNQTVLLVDLDLRHPSISGYFVEDALPGLSDHLTNDRPIGELLIDPGIERLVILPGTPQSFTNSSEMLSSPKMTRLVEELKNRYADRLILFDMPPVFAGDDVIAIAPYLDAVMLVVEEGKTKKDDLLRAYELLDKEKVIGAVLNKSDQASSALGYYY